VGGEGNEKNERKGRKGRKERKGRKGRKKEKNKKKEERVERTVSKQLDKEGNSYAFVGLLQWLAHVKMFLCLTAQE